ncbi:UvrD-helicase domain-containing protein [Pedobacter sp. MC2016-14]|uniref:UvrD-helicase domain-containing protein n=1 Tax=Pedobacter sp. MC2016-14 TaxID=2897327 RepID=UPI001E484539|nr:UvrD-helicase domain-containing protein [Pedobacter sp. MC2016-14]MCD0489714.1 UvrD-helicase domain-containing protein [Pedobacter sp. MC2016-14]
MIIYILGLLSLCTCYLYYRYRQRALNKEHLLSILPHIRQAELDFEEFFDEKAYFANYDYQQLKSTHTPLLTQIPPNYKRYGLSGEDFEIVDHFMSLHRDAENTRANYNEHFSKLEINRYRSFFSSLEQYPLSDEQMKAIVCDEDNNLVIAGAGTGKTTTISAKIAYILNKKLARPEELLVISFTNSAVNELYDRVLKFCGKDSGVDQITVNTFNGFGNKVVRHCNRNPLRIAFDGKDHLVKEFLLESFTTLFHNDDDFQSKAINFFAFFNRQAPDDFEFKTAEEFRKHQESTKYVSLSGRELKSYEETLVANFLYLHQVEYEYESFFPLAAEDRNPDYSHYAPDFYLPKYGIYIEHYGIDQNGDVPQWFSYRPPFTDAKSSYHSGIQWKEQIHKKYETKLVRTYSYQKKDHTLLRLLKQQLVDFGVVLVKRDPAEIYEELNKVNDIPSFIGLIHTFLTLLKSAGRSPAELKSVAKDQRFAVFMDMVTPLYNCYQEKLKATASIDFNDMINHATAYILNGTFKKQYKYILVDEFQDMSQSKYAMLNALKTANPGAKLYAVGDDWQSIFRFAGSDISIINSFSAHFGFTAYNPVLQTYRFNKEILKVSSSFIQKNPAQLPKKLTSPFNSSVPAFQFVPLKKLKKLEAEHDRYQQIDAILRDISIQTPNASVFLIGRYKHLILPSLPLLKKSYPQLKISFYTAHGSKGLTCDYSILLGLDSGAFGFPSQIADDPVLSYVLESGDGYENAEERRLFYVALTRAKHKVFLLYSMNSPSKFIEELRADYELGG